MPMYTYVDQRLILGILLDCSLLYLLRQVNKVQLACSGDDITVWVVFSVMGLQVGHCTCLALSMGPGNLNYGFHTYTVSAFSTEPSS